MYNMRIKESLFISMFIIAGFVLAACNLSAATEPAPIDQSAAYTIAAQTIIAQYTQEAGQQTPMATESGQEPATDTPPGPSASPTPTESPTATQASPTATQTTSPSPVPTATLSTGDPKTGLGEPAFIDTFDSDANWSLYTDDHVSFTVRDSNMVMVAFEPERYTGWTITWPQISDFYLEITAEQQQCSGLDHYGMIFRTERDDEDYVGYFFGISCDGQYYLSNWDGSRYVPLIDWTPSDAILTGSDQTNRIGVMAEGNRISLYANGKLMKEFNDDTYQEGRFGVGIGSVNTTDFNTWVHEIAYWDIP